MSTQTTTTAVRPLLSLGRTRVLVKPLVLSGEVGYDELPKGYALLDGYYITVSRWKGARLRKIGFGLAIATAKSK